MTERTPLLYRGNNNGGGGIGPASAFASGVGAVGNDRRGGRHHHQQQQRRDDADTAATNYAGYDDDDDGFDGEGGTANGKRDRRGLLGRFIGNVRSAVLATTTSSSRRPSSAAFAAGTTTGTVGGGESSTLTTAAVQDSFSATAGGGIAAPHPPLQRIQPVVIAPSTRGGGGGGVCGGGRLRKAMSDEQMYEDLVNDEPWNCRCGTSEGDGIWLNSRDRVGTLMSSLVWVLFLYSCVTVVMLAESSHAPRAVAAVYCSICALALASHAKTCVTDPGSVPSSALPVNPLSADGPAYCHAMCSVCQTYKPPGSHHCRICNRCISRMDHHCPWMNNCIGVGNLKHFILFLVYTWTSCTMALLLFGINYFFCTSPNCEFDGMEIQLVRAMTWLSIGALLFTSSMIISVVYGVLTGIGTIDRLKRKASDTWHDSIDEPTPLSDIFGIGPYWTWFFPCDPIFEDYDKVMGFATLTRLLRKGSGAVPTMTMSMSMNRRGNSMPLPYGPVDV